MHFIDYFDLTDEREIPQEAQPGWENSSLGFIEAVISGNERCHTTDAHYRMYTFSLSSQNQ